MKVDVHRRQQQFRNWKARALEEGVPGLTKQNGAVLVRYVLDMEAGINTARSAPRGGRGFARLCTLAQRMKQLLGMLQSRGYDDVTKVGEDAVVQLFTDMERGTLLTSKGTIYRSRGDYAKVFKAFWHWWMLVNRKNGVVVADLTSDVSSRSDLPQFVYLQKQDVDRLLPYFSESEQVLLLFLFDSLIRAPTEVLSLRASDIDRRGAETWVTVRQEISKTIGRTFNLLYAGPAIEEYITRRGILPDEPLFDFSPTLLNRKLKAAAAAIWGESRSHPQGDLYRNLTLYDFRHSGAIHFRLLAKANPGQVSLDAIRHRAGWSNFEELNYYTRFIGIDGHIERPGAMITEERHGLEREVESLRAEVRALMDTIATVGRLAAQGASPGVT